MSARAVHPRAELLLGEDVERFVVVVVEEDRAEESREVEEPLADVGAHVIDKARCVNRLSLLAAVALYRIVDERRLVRLTSLRDFGAVGFGLRRGSYLLKERGEVAAFLLDVVRHVSFGQCANDT